ncbi:DUF2236 domain-containing protein [Pseudonocardia sp. HH130629-09]|uniref:DUF2236 domain-containing protein n=1 Tax=Pseudonocardia sp. HH130629-09 TaxID=1641402 RepID=UPI000760E504|nr:DUF2236 domain-containing protein [Pseudonocardia sp. HH130629-09]
MYESPSIAKVLSTTGRLVDRADKRLTETGAWLTQAMLPGNLRRGRPGYVATLNVRMLHAHMRRLALDRGYDTAPPTASPSTRWTSGGPGWTSP